MSFTRRVITGTGIIALSGAATRLFSFFTVPILTRLLGPEPYGVAALAGTIVSLGTTLALLGVDMGYARFFLQGEPAHQNGVERFCWRFAFRNAFWVAILSLLGWYFLGQRWVPRDYQFVAIFSFLAIVLGATVIMATTRVRLSGNYRKIAIAQVSGALVLVAVNLLVAVMWRRDAYALLLGTLCASVATLIILGLPGKKSMSVKSLDIPVGIKRAVLKFSVAGSITAPMYWVISSSDRWFLAEYASSASIGIYSVAVSVATFGLMINNGLTLTWFPEISRIYADQNSASLALIGRLWQRMTVGLSMVWLIVSGAGGDVLRLMAAPQFHQGAYYIPWLAGGVFFYGLASLANTAFFLAGQMGKVALLWILGAIVSLGLNFWLVPNLAAQGAALTQCVSYGAIAVGIIAASRKILPLPVEWGRLVLSLAMVMVAGVIMSYQWFDNPLLSLLSKIPFGLLLTFLVGSLIAPDWHTKGFSRVRRVIGVSKT